MLCRPFPLPHHRFPPFVSSLRHYNTFRAGDIVVLRRKLDRSAPPILTRPLSPDKSIHSHKGVIPHSAIIGKRARDVLCTAPLKSGKEDGAEFRLFHVRLDEYVRLSRRLVTPVYPADAQVIVGLLDLHPDVFDPDVGQEKLEILEAGTGHGALTLYLSRAIHATNPPRPDISELDDDEAALDAMREWKARRKAIVHTIDSSAKYSRHARQTIAGFRRGMYLHNVDFHVTSVSTFVKKSLEDKYAARATEKRDDLFLSHAVLDLPGVEKELDIVSQALKTDGCLVVFCPSISQIMECVRTVKEDGLPLEMERCVELGVNGTSGGREWNVRAVKLRARPAMAEEEDDGGDVEREEGEITVGKDSGSQDEKEAEQSTPAVQEPSSPELAEVYPSDGYSMICRPKVGERIVGGGFVAVWRKQRDMREGGV